MHKIYMKTMYLDNLFRYDPSLEKRLVLIYFLALKTCCYMNFFLTNFILIKAVF